MAELVPNVSLAGQQPQHGVRPVPEPHEPGHGADARADAQRTHAGPGEPHGNRHGKRKLCAEAHAHGQAGGTAVHHAPHAAPGRSAPQPSLRAPTDCAHMCKNVFGASPWLKPD